MTPYVLWIHSSWFPRSGGIFGLDVVREDGRPRTYPVDP